MVQSSNIGFEFNTAADLIQIYENSTTSELLDEALINDGRTDTGQNVEFNISIDGFSSVNSSDAVGLYYLDPLLLMVQRLPLELILLQLNK